MKRTSLIASSLFAASFALAPFAHATVSNEGEVYVTFDDDAGSVQQPAIDSEQSAKREKELAELREQIYRDMQHE